MEFYKIWEIEDCIRIRNAAIKLGYDITLREAEELWGEYSSDLCASWLFLPDTEEELIKTMKELIGG